MQGTTQPIDRQTLLEKANKLIREHEDTLAGIEATDVVQRNNVLVFSGEFYLDEQGLPTPKSTAVFNMFKYLAHELSDKYHLVDLFPAPAPRTSVRRWPPAQYQVPDASGGRNP